MSSSSVPSILVSSHSNHNDKTVTFASNDVEVPDKVLEQQSENFKERQRRISGLAPPRSPTGRSGRSPAGSVSSRDRSPEQPDQKADSIISHSKFGCLANGKLSDNFIK